MQIAQRLQNPVPQFPSAHRRDRAIERREQAHVPRAARFYELEVHLRGGVKHHEIVPRIATQRRQVVHLPPQLLLQVMDDRSGRTDRRRHFGATKTVQRFDPEMFAQGKAGVIGQEREVVVSQRARDLAEVVHLPFAHQNFRWRNPREIVEEPAAVFRFGQAEFARAQFRVGKTEFAFMKINRAQIIRPVGLQQIELAHRSRRDDLGDLAGDDFPRLRFAGLIADGNAPPGLDELGDVTLGGVIRHAAHRDAVAMSEGEVQQPGRFLGVLEKQLVKSPSRKSRSVSAGTDARSRWYCCIIGVSASGMVLGWNRRGAIASRNWNRSDRTYATYMTASPSVVARAAKSSLSRSVTGPTRPLPITWPSSLVTPASSPIVPVQHISSA